MNPFVPRLFQYKRNMHRAHPSTSAFVRGSMVVLDLPVLSLKNGHVIVMAKKQKNQRKSASTAALDEDDAMNGGYGETENKKAEYKARVDDLSEDEVDACTMMLTLSDLN